MKRYENFWKTDDGYKIYELTDGELFLTLTAKRFLTYHLENIYYTKTVKMGCEKKNLSALSAIPLVDFAVNMKDTEEVFCMYKKEFLKEENAL